MNLLALAKRARADTESEQAKQRREAPPTAVRVLYSFPHRIGAGRICETAWQQVEGLARAGAHVSVYPASLQRPFPSALRVHETLARGRARIPYRLIGSRRAFGLHDRLVSRALRQQAMSIDVVHAWPLGSEETLRAAAELGIPTVLERPNAHTRFAYETVRAESARLEVELPRDHEHAFNADVLAKEEREYEVAYRLLCPSDFVLTSFLDAGFSRAKLARHIYGFDPDSFFPAEHRSDRPFTAVFVGVAAVRKGLHFALEAWLGSVASDIGRFVIAGEILPSYGERLRQMLEHPSVEVLGHRSDVADLMRQSDVLLLPSIEEGSALVCAEALACGCALLVSEAATAASRHGQNALVHRVGDVASLTEHLNAVVTTPDLLGRLRAGALQSSSEFTWAEAGMRLLDVYRETIEAYKQEHGVAWRPLQRQSQTLAWKGERTA